MDCRVCLSAAGGDGGRLFAQKKKMAQPQQQMAGDYYGSMPSAAYCMGAAAPCCAYGGAGEGVRLTRQAATAKTPVLRFLAQPAAVVTQLQLGPDGSLQIEPQRLHKLLSDAAGVSSTDREAAAARSAWDVTGCRMVYAAVYDPRVPGQFGSAWCAVQGVDTRGTQQQEEAATGAAAAGAVGPDGARCLPAAARRDMGLDRPIDPGVVSALVSRYSP